MFKTLRTPDPSPPGAPGRSLTALLATLLLLVGTAEPISGQSRGWSHPSVDVEAVDDIFGSWDSTRSPGCAVAVAINGETVLSRAYGMSDLEHGVPNHPSTIFEAGSVSKQFAAAAVILLVLDGEVDLDDDIREYFPELPDYGTPIRVHHLLNHTSGLRDWGSVAAISGWGRSDRSHNHDHVLEIAARQTALNYPPGDAYSYTNTGYNLMAVLVERVSGESFADFSDERIFAPLGLTHTEWRDDYQRVVPGRSSAYSPSGNGFRINRPIEDVHGNGGLLTTVGDLLTWDRALRDGSFHGPEFTELMHRQGVLNDGRQIEYASALFVGERRGVPHISHTGATSGYRAYLGHYPEQELSVALLCNVTNANPGGLGGQVSDVFLGDLPEPESPQPPDGVELQPADLEARAGLYRHETHGEPLRLSIEDDQLRLGNTALIPRSTTEFLVGSTDRTIHFDGPPSGTRTPFAITDAGYPGGRYLPTEAADPDADALREFEGLYRSEDAETTLEIREEDGELVVHRRPSTQMSLNPIYPDAFQGGLGLLRFHRNAGGAITELSLRQGRVHDIRFERVGNQ
ncbi:MAG: class A beta-lactamase-related serine hydrolase [Gemmatimonadales bacterium]|nr:MAG: class A beta-lactamase-related serine hydrolase [Gemmatimonadales bacterium]